MLDILPIVEPLNVPRRQKSDSITYRQDSSKQVILRGALSFISLVGYASIATTLRSLRTENERMQRMREAIQNEDFDDLEELDDVEDNGPSSNTTDIY